MSELTDHLHQLRDEMFQAKGRLLEAVNDACPGRHTPRQHRDGRPPWCPACGRDELGQHRALVDHTPARPDSAPTNGERPTHG